MSAAAAMRAWVEIDHAAIRHNLERVRARLAAGTRTIAVVKANAYGHGAVEVGRTAAVAGADLLAVYCAGDGAVLRQAGIALPIILLGPSEVHDVATVVAHRLTPTVCDAAFARALAAAVPEPWPVHVKVDTGMHRFGVPIAAAAALMRDVSALPQLRIAGVYTHFAAVCADDAPAMEAQLQSFSACTAVTRLTRVRACSRGAAIHQPLLHACNSLALDVLPQAHLDAVRIGGAMYGLATGSPWLETALEPTLTLKTRLVYATRVSAGATVGYGATWRAARPSRLALLPLGYADGLPRALSNRGAVLIRGQRAPIAGVISMNQTIVDVTDVPEARVGDEVVLIGRQGRQCLRAGELAALYGGCAYELTAGLRESLPRRHVDDAAAQ